MCRAVAISAATQGVLDRQTALALKPALDQIGEVLEEVRPCYVCQSLQDWTEDCLGLEESLGLVAYCIVFFVDS